MISDTAIMKEIMHQRNPSIENPLAYNFIPEDVVNRGQYQDILMKHQSRRRAFPQIYHHH
jgi:hypothetical protein